MTNETSTNSYKTILKRISAFGGLQIFNIFVNLLRGKFVAIILGPAGMGVSSLFLTASTTLQQLGSLGLNLSIVKEVAARQSTDSHAAVMTVSRILILLTSLLGAVLCAVLAPWLSEWTFGNRDYTWGFILLGGAVGLGIAGTGYQAILQGVGEIKRLSKASIVGSMTGLCFGVPLYYFFGTRGIVPAMVILALSLFLFYWISFRKAVKTEKIDFNWSDHSPLVRKLISLGIIFMIGSLVGSATNYVINAIVRYFGSLDDVGFFQAANSLTNQYIGIVFSALALDYFPRISAVSHDSAKLQETVNRQAEIVILLATPLLLGLITLTPLAIRILLSAEFLNIIPLIRWLAIGTLLQAVTFPLGYVFIAKDNKKAYVWVEVVIANLLWIICSVAGYLWLGLIGLGVSLVVRTAIDIGISYSLCRHFYGFRYSRRVILTIAGCLLPAAAGFACSLSTTQTAQAGMWAITITMACVCLVRLRTLVNK
ncbi:MAG: oligosaccharide flippase family protein [Muribaculaceae bacterium]|nr:oligosaccharide flippase family protein [Muribaculaceae bacterium]